MEYEPEYPILRREECREDIELVPEEQLKPLERAELSRLREGFATYSILTADTRENRGNIALKTAYYQMVAFKEGWTFNPQKYQVRFVDPSYFLLGRRGEQTRIYNFKDSDEREGTIGFVLRGETARRIEDEEAESIGSRVIKFFRRE